MNRQALVIMAKAPDPDNVKTRLKGSLSDRQRVALYESLLEGTVERLRALEDTDTFITYTPEEHSEYFSRFGLSMFPQEGSGLGERMHLALTHVLGMGYEAAALVGVDIPGLGPVEVQEAIRLLARADVVFGPALDGGYYLVGMKSPEAGLFDGVQWSTERTLEQSLERASALGLGTALCRELSDIDTVEDLRRFGLI